MFYINVLISDEISKKFKYKTYLKDFMNLNKAINILDIKDENMIKPFITGVDKLFSDYNAPLPSLIVEHRVFDEETVGIFDEDKPTKIKISNLIYVIPNDETRLYYLLHEMIHYLDYHIYRTTRSEVETDIEALGLMVDWGIISENDIVVVDDEMQSNY